MSLCVKSLKVTYRGINERNTFTNGDWISGQVTLEVAKDCQIDSLSIQFKGKADVYWSERWGHSIFVYQAKEKYLGFKLFFIQDKDFGKDNQRLIRDHNGETCNSVVAPGCHVYPFTFQIPSENIPSSFMGSHGKIVYSLKAKLHRSLRIDKTDSTSINFVSKAALNTRPQHESKDKKMKVFSSGTVSMDVNIEKTGFFQGEGLKVLASIQNNSSREIRPKYCVYRKHSFFAKGEKKVHTMDIFTRVITIPRDLEPSILNCNIIKVEYRLRVYLDIKFASDPEIKFPIIILPASQVPPVGPPPTSSGYGFEAFGNPNPPVWGLVPPQPPAAPQPFGAPPPYEAHGVYPPLKDVDTKR
ncbi:hypothetical protein Q5P01_014585 [Channa striata]|uniref:Arrestin C-terminal-like domain-containing protein n=1 Tax=Channa striata TaxID=64152 RepID=A0AA88MJ22_CHASR|nr:hypothetical protein Q5P01_014585 [Channa striata]